MLDTLRAALSTRPGGAVLASLLDKLTDQRRPHSVILVDLAAARSEREAAGRDLAAVRERADRALRNAEAAVVEAQARRDAIAREHAARLHALSNRDRFLESRVAQLEQEARQADVPELDELAADLRKQLAEQDRVEPAGPGAAAFAVTRRRALTAALRELDDLRTANAPDAAALAAIRSRLAATVEQAAAALERAAADTVRNERLRLLAG